MGGCYKGMRIQIWSDFQCPFCYMGEKKLEKVLGSIVLTEPIELEYRAYELNPEAPVKPVETMTDHFMAGHEMTRQEAEARMEKISRMASEVGLDYRLADVKVCNTLDAHRLMKYSAERLNPGKLKKLNFSLFKAVFEEGKLISDRQLLAAEAEKVGLSGEEVMRMLEGDSFIDAVRKDEEEIDAREDFEFVPFMLMDNGTVKQGVVSERGLKDWLTGAMSDTDTESSDSERAGCGPGGCSI